MSEFDRSAVLDRLAAAPRHQLGHLPTPLERLDRLTAELGGPEIWIKRDDCTGLALGGNKTRKLEYLVAAAQAEECDTLVTVGKIQSNHARQTAAAAAAVGMDCLLLVEELPADVGPRYQVNGNALLNRVLGATVEVSPPSHNTSEQLERRIADLVATGAAPFFIPAGGSTGVGALGYVGAMVELADQLAAAEVAADRLVLATGSGGTQAGLLVGAAAAGLGIEVLGACVSSDASTQVDKVVDVAAQCAAEVGAPMVDRESIAVDDRFIGPSYGVPDDATLDAIRLFARTEGIVLDPVYTGKAAAGLIDGCRTGRFGRDERIVFLHTGGQAANFAYETWF